MYSKRHFILPLALSLGAFSQGSLAVTNIDTCQTITDSGSFRLTRNLTANGNCLVIQAKNVTLDLQGHTLTGNGTGAGVLVTLKSGVFNPPRTGIAVRNGVVTNFGDGIDFSHAPGAVVERVRAIENTNNGILVGALSVVSASVANSNKNGIVTDNFRTDGDGASITDNVVTGNDGFGIFSERGATIRGNSVRTNASTGMFVRCPSAVIGNSVTGNSGGNLVLNGSRCLSSQNATLD